MTCRTFDPQTANFTSHISVERTENATILNVPRNLDAFAVKEKPTFVDRVADFFSFS